MSLSRSVFLFAMLAVLGSAENRALAAAQPAFQPLQANIQRVVEALEVLGAPLSAGTLRAVQTAAAAREVSQLQDALDPEVLFVVELNPEARVKVRRGKGQAVLQENGFTPVLVKVINQSGSSPKLRMVSPAAGQRYAGMSPLSAQRMQRTALGETLARLADPSRFLELQIYSQPPMSETLSGLEVEYAIALIYSSEAGEREATIGFDVFEGNQDLGFRGEVPVLFQIRPAVPVRLRIADEDGRLAVARLTFHDAAGHIYPPQPKRLAPDLYFQRQIYRRDGDMVFLPPGKLTVEFSRGPEYRTLRREIMIPAAGPFELELALQRWVNPMQYGFYSGDHHIHAAGCAHYTSPSEGVRPQDMFLQVSGEGLNVGCILTWGPCFDYQRQFFAPTSDRSSDPWHVMKYDLEISGFGSEALGHVCLLNLKDETYPGSNGGKDRGWPTWTTPVMRWAKAQGGVAGYAHSGSGLEIDASAASRRLLARFDANHDAVLSRAEAAGALLPASFDSIDDDGDGALTESELIAAHQRAADRLPNLAVPEMNGVGAMEICVSLSEGVCDFISAMDTSRIAEWNMWYHLLNCGFPLKVSGETDFPCMSGERVGQGRVYVQLGKIERLDFAAWCRALAAGRSYVSDGFAHALEFAVEGVAPGFGEVKLDQPGRVRVQAKVAFAPETPETVAQGTRLPPGGMRFIGDTVTLHGPRTDALSQGGMRRVELVVNGEAVQAREVPADGRVHPLEFQVEVKKSSWLALRQLPELHTNPVNVLVNGRPIRVSRRSALWCIETIDQLWRQRARKIAAEERDEAQRTFERAKEKFRKIAAECDEP